MASGSLYLFPPAVWLLREDGDLECLHIPVTLVTHTGRRQSEIFLVGWTDGGVTLEETDSYVILLEKP